MRPAPVARGGGTTLVFVRARASAEAIAAAAEDPRVAAHHGGLSNRERARVVGAFRRGELDVLVSTSTSLNAGVHLPSVTLVVSAAPCAPL